MIDLSRARKTPYAHQVAGVEWLYDYIRPEEGRIYPGCYLLADDMRLGKTKQVIDTACILFEQNQIDSVIVVAPAPVRGVWFDEELGELKKHLWEGLPHQVIEYHGKNRAWGTWENDKRYLRWIVTNYDFIGIGVKKRKKEWSGWNLDFLLNYCNQRTLLVLDETAWIKSSKAGRTRACMALRRQCGRVILLNGTPIAHSPGDLFSQAYVMDHRILGCETSADFKAKYADMERKERKDGRRFVVVKEWKNLEELQQRLAPYVLRRMRVDCLDLPPKLDPVTLEVELSKSTWKIYQDMKEEFIYWFNENTTASAAQASVRVMRLAQITSGILGGVKEETLCPLCDPEQPSNECKICEGSGFREQSLEPQFVGREKLDVQLDWIESRLEQDPEFRMVIWCRFRPEVQRLYEEILQRFPQIHLAKIHGGQSKLEREESLKLVHPDFKYEGPAVVIGTQQTGSVGINMAGAHEVIYLSNMYSLFLRKQSEDRPHGPGQTQPVSYHDIVAVGPNGQRTIDHTIVKSLHAREEVANWTCSAWVKALREES